MNLKAFIAGATVASSVALIVAELARDQLQVRREQTETLAEQVGHFARKESIGEELRKTVKPISTRDTQGKLYQDLAESEEYQQEKAEKRIARSKTREHPFPNE